MMNKFKNCRRKNLKITEGKRIKKNKIKDKAKMNRINRMINNLIKKKIKPKREER